MTNTELKDMTDTEKLDEILSTLRDIAKAMDNIGSSFGNSPMGKMLEKMMGPALGNGRK